MGFLNRIGKITHGLYQGFQAPVGMIYDFARAPFTDEDDLNGFFNTLNTVTTTRAGDMFGNLFSEQRGVHGLTSLVPGSEIAGAGLHQAFRGIEAAGETAIRRPIATAITAASLSQSEADGASFADIPHLFRPEIWGQAWEISETRSVGQAFILALGTKDILDEDEVDEFMGTDLFSFASGTTDALLRLFYDVDIALAKMPRVAKLARGTDGPHFIAHAPPTIGGRRAIARAEGDSNSRLLALDNIIVSGYASLPKSVQRWVGSPDAFSARDLGRLERLEIAQRRQRAEVTRQRAGMAGDDIEHAVLTRLADSQETRIARIEAGQISSTIRDKAADARQQFIDAYMSAPARKGMVDQVVRGPRWRDVDQQIVRWADEAEDSQQLAGIIRDRLFPTHERGDIIGHFLAEAGSMAERQNFMRIFMGDLKAFGELVEQNYALARRVQDLTGEMGLIRTDPIWGLRVGKGTQAEQVPGQQTFLDDSPIGADFKMGTERLERLADERRAVLSDLEQQRRIEHAFKSVADGAQAGLLQRGRARVKSGSLYQESAFGNAARVFTDMRPHHLVDVGDAMSDAHLARMMREAGFSDAAIASRRGEYMKLTPEQRGPMFEQSLMDAERKIMAEYGVSADEIEQILQHAAAGRKQARSMIHAAKYDGEGRAIISALDGEIVEIPLLVTQLQNVVPVTNFRELRRHLEHYRKMRDGGMLGDAGKAIRQPAHVSRALLSEFGNAVMDVWKPMVLIRPAWTVRVVLLDEQMRTFAKFGAMASLLSKRKEMRDYMVNLKEAHPRLRQALRLDKETQRLPTVLSAVAGTALGGPAGGAAAGLVANRVLKKWADMERAGARNMQIGGHGVQPAFGLPGQKAELYRARASSAQDVDELLGRWDSSVLNNVRQNPYEWRSYHWGESPRINEAYKAAWVDSVRLHLAQDDLAKMAMRGATPEEMLRWLRQTPEGQAHAAKIPGRANRLDEWVDAVHEQVHAYTYSDEVRNAILNTSDRAKDSTWTGILDMIPEEARAVIHGKELEQILGRSRVQTMLNDFVENAFQVLGTAPTDELARFPAFRMFYETRMNALVGDIAPGRIELAQLRRLENQARDYALKESRLLLYDLAERSQFAHMTRLLMPFFPAWQEVLTRWAGIVAENPMVAAYGRKIWNAPNKAGWTYEDDQGNEFVVMRVPEWAAPLLNQGIFKSALDHKGQLYLDKSGFNLVASGTPGFGPFVQYGMSEIVRQQPQLEDSVKFILPFGPTQGFDAFLTPIIRRTWATQQGESSRAFSSAYNQIIQTRLTNMQLGEEPMLDLSDGATREAFLADVMDEARAFMHLRTFAGAVMPTAPLWESPYKPYVDVYRALTSGDIEHAQQVAGRFLGDVDTSALDELEGAERGDFEPDEVFLEMFGPEFYALTQSYTESLNGVPPTVEGLEAGEMFGELIASHPEWGGVIAGYDGGGEAVKFSRAVYDRQLERGERRRLSSDEIATRPDVRLGWVNYSKAMDSIENMRVSMGLPNMQVAEAEMLRNIKQATILTLAAQHPNWYQEFAVTDRNKWHRTIEGARAIVQNPELMGRPDIRGLKDYLDARDLIMALLALRPHQTLTARANTDLAMLWSTLTAKIVEENPAFADLYYRKLERDPLTQDPLGQRITV